MDLLSGRINVKRSDLLVIGIGVLASNGFFAMERAYAGEDEHPTRCTPATLHANICLTGQRRCFRRLSG
jgi:hypothetical protein